MAKFCSNCGTALTGGEKFCSNCGAAVEVSEPPKPVCPHCGKAVKTTSKFCPQCGKDVRQTQKPQNPQAAFPQTGGTAVRQAVFPQTGGTAVRQAAFSQTSTAVRQAVSQTPMLQNAVSAPSVGGEFTVGVNGIMERTKGGMAWIRSLIAGLGAGGISCAALWNAEKPMLISGCIAAAVVVVRVAVGIVRRRKK